MPLPLFFIAAAAATAMVGTGKTMIIIMQKKLMKVQK